MYPNLVIVIFQRAQVFSQIHVVLYYPGKEKITYLPY